MSLAPLLDAAPQIPLHAFAAMAAFALGVVQLAAPKGTLPHRALGWIWVALMMGVALSSFWIHQIRLAGPWSPIHLLSIFVLMVVPLGVWRAHRHQVADHRRIMILIFSGALVIAGLFTLLPGRHARRGVRFVSPRDRDSNRGSRRVFKGRFRGRGDDGRRPRKYLEKRREKPLTEAS
jgi:uncharacterized membrane protein